MRTFSFILLMIAGVICYPDIVLAQEISDEIPSWVGRLLERIPAETVAWVMAIFGFLNGISNGLEKLVRLTETKKDDKALAYLKKFLGSMQKFIDFFTAKGMKSR